MCYPDGAVSLNIPLTRDPRPEVSQSDLSAYSNSGLPKHLSLYSLPHLSNTVGKSLKITFVVLYTFVLHYTYICLHLREWNYG